MTSQPDLSTKQGRDAANIMLRQSDVWRTAIKSMGLNPDGPLKLSKAQQTQLAQSIGLDTGDVHIDPAGNINDYHGWKGLPTAVKVGIIGGAAAATMGAAGAFGGGAGAASAAGGGAGATGAGGASTAATVAGAAGGGGSAWGKIGGFVKGHVGDLVGMGGNIFSAAGDAATENRNAALNAGLTQAQMQLEQQKAWEDMVMRRQADDRVGMNNAVNQSVYGSYMKGYKGVQSPDPQGVSMAGTSPEAAATADALIAKANDRITNGSGLAPIDQTKYVNDPALMKPGGWEKVTGVLGPALTGWSALMRPKAKDKAVA